MTYALLQTTDGRAWWRSDHKEARAGSTFRLRSAKHDDVLCFDLKAPDLTDTALRSIVIIMIRIAAVDLFCGIGGMTHGLVLAGIPVTHGIDVDPTCRFGYEANNHGAQFVEKSVTKVSSADLESYYPPGCVRILVGCAPCQPFSNYANRYEEDHKWGLLYAFRDLITQAKPDIVSMENVPELASRRHQVYSDFVDELRRLKYHVDSKVVKCAEYGVPQLRERLVLLASKRGPLSLIPPTHSPDKYVTVRESISSLAPIKAGATAIEHDPLHKSSRLSNINLRRIKKTPEGGGWKDWPKALRLKCHLKDTGTEYVSVYGRMAWDSLAPTMTTQCYGFGNGRFGHPEQDRAISLREAALLQTFPIHYKFAAPSARVTFRHTGKHIGNAVPVRLGEIVGKSILIHLAQG